MCRAAIFTILWDNDGVLVDTEGLYFRATQTVLQTVGIDLAVEQFKEISLPGAKARSPWPPTMESKPLKFPDCGPSGTASMPICRVRSRGSSTGPTKCCGRCMASAPTICVSKRTLASMRGSSLAKFRLNLPWFAKDAKTSLLCPD